MSFIREEQHCLMIIMFEMNKQLQLVYVIYVEERENYTEHISTIDCRNSPLASLDMIEYSSTTIY